MSRVSVCVRFRPLSSREKKEHGEETCIQSIDADSITIKDEKDGELTFCFDRVFLHESSQEEIYEFLAMPIVQDAIGGINGTIMTYGQTGAGKTYSMEGPGVLECDEQRKGIIPRVIEGLFKHIQLAAETFNSSVKLSMVMQSLKGWRFIWRRSEIFLICQKITCRLRKGRGKAYSFREQQSPFTIILLSHFQISIIDSTEGLRWISRGISNRAVGETQMNMSSSRSHCIYIFAIQQDGAGDDKARNGKLALVDLAGSEKVERTGAEGKVLEEAKTINKSLSALGIVINALTNGKGNHVPYRDSKLTRILQDALGGNSRTALLCCCSPSSLNASETLSTLRFGARTKLIKTPVRVNAIEDKIGSPQTGYCQPKHDAYERILQKLRENFSIENVKLLEEILVMEGIIFNPDSMEHPETEAEDLACRTITLLQQTVEDLSGRINRLQHDNMVLRAKATADAHANAESYCSWIMGWFTSAFTKWGVSKNCYIQTRN